MEGGGEEGGRGQRAGFHVTRVIKILGIYLSIVISVRIEILLVKD